MAGPQPHDQSDPLVSADATAILTQLRRRATDVPITSEDLDSMRQGHISRPDLVSHIGMNGRIVMINAAFRAPVLYLAAWGAGRHDGAPAGALSPEESSWLQRRFFLGRPVQELSKKTMSVYFCHNYSGGRGIAEEPR